MATHEKEKKGNELSMSSRKAPIVHDGHVYDGTTISYFRMHKGIKTQPSPQSVALLGDPLEDTVLGNRMAAPPRT